MEMERPVFGIQVFARPSLTVVHRGDFEQKGLTRFLPVYHIKL